MVEEQTSLKKPKINNVKARFTVHPSEIDLLKKSVQAFGVKTLRNAKKKYKKKIKKKGNNKKKLFQQYHNFTVLRGKNTYIVFTKSGTVNITGVRSLTVLSRAVNNFCKQFGVNKDLITRPIIDNITATGSFQRPINLLKLKQLVNNNKENTSGIISVASNPSYFPSAFCRTSNSTTCSVFEKGTYNIIGAKCQKEIQEVMKQMNALIQKL